MEESVRPTGVEQVLAADQIIVSKTDPKGRLTYVNDVFLQISGFEETELIGKPHNVVRHPSMPRSIFKLLWDRISSGEELFAYVLNLCKDGGHYWVLAHVTPSKGPGGHILGYHSNRRKPAPGSIERITAIYDRLLAAERAESSKPAALAAGTALLEQILAEAGVTYDEFVWNLTNECTEAAA